MPFSKRGKTGSIDKGSSSFGSKLKNFLAKDKPITTPATDEYVQDSPPPTPQQRQQQQQQLSSAGQAGDVDFWRLSPLPSSSQSYGYRSPHPLRQEQPSQWQSESVNYENRPQAPLERPPYSYHTQGPASQPQNEYQAQAQTSPNHSDSYTSASHISYQSPTQGRISKGNDLYPTNDRQPYLNHPVINSPQRIPQLPSAQGTTPVPQCVVVQALDDPPSEDDEDDNPQLVLLLPTDDGRYLPVNFGRGRPNLRAPSPSILLSGRQEEQRVLYLDSASNSSTSSLSAAPPPAITHAEYNERAPRPHPRFTPVEDDAKVVDGDDEPFNPDFTSIAPSPGPGTPNGTHERNLNRRFDYLPGSMVPFWYKKYTIPAPQGSRQYLCVTCRHIDLLALFKQEETTIMPKPRDYIVLGSLLDLIARKDCGLCSLVAGIVAFDTGADLSSTISDEQRKDKQRARLMALMDEVYYLCPIRFKTSYRTPALYICNGKDVVQMCRQSSIIRPRRTMAIRPIHKSEGNLGRLLMKPDQIDFEWIQERMKLCDERDLSKLDYEHTVSIRVIDVNRRCIVGLEDGARYVTLSYTWGNVTQLKLLKNNEASFRAGGLRRRYNEIPKTIQDSIELVRRIGERYIWVDALCIVQDDPADFRKQITEMGNIYKHSILTICACCGEDANYGLPGIQPGTRKTTQVAEVVGDLVIGNAMADSEAVEGAKWDTRGWTLQEKVLSQRKLYISDKYALWWCWHTITAEDENCRHRWWQPGTRHRGMYFYKSEHDLVVSQMRKSSNMDIYAFIITDYTARDLTNPSDAEHAVTGAMNAIAGLFRGSFVQGLPDSELSAALLWSPLGLKSSERRVHPETKKPLFPSWSWLGWKGHVAYPWLIERTLPMSEDGSPLEWKNSWLDVGDDEKWFTGEMYRMGGLSPNFMERLRGREDRWSIDSDGGWAWIDQYSESHRWLHPVEDRFEEHFRFISSSSPHRLCFRTLSAHFVLDSCICIRKENHDYLHKVSFVRVLNAQGFCAGYIYTPSEQSMSDDQRVQFSGGTIPREFVVLSRASTNPDPRIGDEILYTTPIDELHSVYAMSFMIGALNRLQPSYGQGNDQGVDSELDETAHFDTRLYDATMPWGLFNVMMIERVDGVAYRVAIGRIHVAAFMEAEPVTKEIVLE